MPTSSSLREFAEAPAAFLSHAAGSRVVDDERFFLAVLPNGSWGLLTRTRFTASAAARTLEEVRGHAPEAKLTLATASAEVARAFRGLGFREPDPPNDPTCTALATDREPSPVAGIDVRRVETYDDFLVGLEIELASFLHTPTAAAERRADAEVTYRRRRDRPGGEWLAYLDGTPVAWAGAVAGARGLYLAGAATLPAARGRGCYRALLRARWLDAVERGTPGLVVHAQDTSRPILERCGFERVCTIHELEGDVTQCREGHALVDSAR